MKSNCFTAAKTRLGLVQGGVQWGVERMVGNDWLVFAKIEFIEGCFTTLAAIELQEILVDFHSKRSSQGIPELICTIFCSPP